MFSFNLGRWLKKAFRSRPKPIERKPRVRLDPEILEDRLAPALFTWTGVQAAATGGVANQWSNPQNWQGNVAPTPSATPHQLNFQFGGTSWFIANNDIPGLMVDQLTIASGTFTLGGPQTLTLANPATNAAAIIVNTGALNEVISMPIQFGTTVASNESITVQAGGASLTLSGQLSGNSATRLSKEGVGTLTLTNNNSGYLGQFSINNSIGNSSVIITNANALGAAVTSELQLLSISGATAGSTQVTLTYPDGIGNPFTSFTYQGTAADATNIQTQLNALFNTLGFAGNPVTVTRTASGAGSASFSLSFGGSMAALSVLTLGASASGGASAAVSTLADGGAPNITTINPNTQLQVNTPGGTVRNPMVVFGAGTDNFSGAIVMNVAGTATLAGNIEMRSNLTFGGVSGSNLIVTGKISDTTPFHLTKEGNGTLYLNPTVPPSALTNFQGGNFYRGNTNVNAGTVQIGHPFALGAGGGTVFVNTNINSTGALQINYTTSFVGVTSSTALFTQPAVGASVSVALISTSWMSVGQTVYIAGGGHYSVLSIPNATTAVLTNLGSNGNAAPGLEIQPASAGTPSIPAQYLNFSQVQTINLSGATAGVTAFTLNFSGAVTAPITFNTSIAGTVQSLLNGLPTIGGIGANVSVVQVGSTFFVTFGGSLGGLEVATLTGVITSAFGTGTISTGTTSGTTPIGFQVPNEYLRFFGTSLTNLAGHNAWNQPTANTAPLGISGSSTINVGTNLNFRVDALYGSGTFSKTGGGRIILPRAMQFTGAVGLQQGALNLRDSFALSGFSPATNLGTSIELQADGTPDSIGSAGLYNLHFPASTTFTLQGTGLNGQGALKNISGVNRIDGSVQLFVGGTTIGVDPDPDPYNVQQATWNNLSQLTINGVMSGSTFVKVGFGELLLTNRNTYTGGTGQNQYQTFIQQGWITIQNAQALGAVFPNLNPADQPGVKVFNGAALVVKRDTFGNNINLPYAMSLAGFGISHRLPWLHQRGALLNLDGNNIFSGDLYFVGPGSIGVQLDGAQAPYPPLNQLILTGTLHDGAGTITGTSTVGVAPIVVTSSNHSLTTGQVVTITGVTGNTAANGTWTVTVVNTNQFSLNGSTGNAAYLGGGTWTIIGKLVKLGDQRLILQGDGVYTGGVEVRTGVLNIQNESALGLGSIAGDVTTTVQSGAALELGATLPTAAGGLERGMQVWYNRLVLNGAGNDFYGDAALQVETNDNVWRGPITLNPNIAVTFQGAAASAALPTMLTTVNSPTGGTLTAITSTQGVSGVGSVPGVNAVQTLTFGGTFVPGDTFTLVVRNTVPLTRTTAAYTQPGAGSSVNVSVGSTSWMSVGQTIFVTDGGYYTVANIVSGTVATLTNTGVEGNATPGTIIFPGTSVSTGATGQTAPIPWDANPNLLIENIQAALDAPAMQAVFGGNFARALILSPTLNIFPNARLTVAGSIGDGVTPADITVAGGGELNLAGNNTFRGTTFLTQGILTIQNSHSLGGQAIPQVQNITLSGATPGVTQFTLSFNGFTTPTPITYTRTAADSANIQSALNALNSIAGIGGAVTVTSNLTNAAQPIFTITLGGALSGFAQPRITVPTLSTGTATLNIVTAGTGGTVVANEAQLQMQGGIEITGEPVMLHGTGNPLQSEVQRVQVSGPAYSMFQLTFTNPNTASPTTSTTISLPMGASATLVENALNALPAIQAGDGSGGGSVIVSQSGLYVYTVVFQGTFTGLSQPWSQQKIDVVGLSGTFNLNFTGFPQTATVAISATPAVMQANLQAAVDALLADINSPGAGDGTAVVTVSSTGSFHIKFGGSLADVGVPALRTSNFVPGATTTTTATYVQPQVGHTVSVSVGSTSWMSVGQSIRVGTNNYTVFSITDATTLVVTNNGTTGNTAPGANVVAGTAVGTVPAVPVSRPVWLRSSAAAQIMSVSGASGTFSLNFTGFAPQATVTIGATPAATQANVQAAINTLLANPSSPGGGTGTVTVDLTATGNYLVTFGGGLVGVDVPMLIAGSFTGAAGAGVSANGSTSAVAEVTVGGTLNATPTQWFNIGPSPVRNAAVNLSTVPNANITGPVSSIAVDPNDVNIIYISTTGGGSWKTHNGGLTWQPLFDGVSSVQSFEITSKQGGTEKYSLTYTDPFTGALIRTDALSFNATAEQLESALTKIVGEGNSVSVRQTIRTNGVDEVQQISLDTTTTTWTSTTVDPVHYTRFQLKFRGVTTGDIAYTGNAGQDALNIQNALNAPGFLPPGGYVSVGVISSSPETFQITFLGVLALSDQPPISFNIGGAGTNFWALNPNPQAPPSPFPTINGIPATGTNATGALTEITAGVGTTYVNTITFSGGALANQNIAPLVVESASDTRTVLSPLIHDYQLNGNFLDALGGPSLVQKGGAITATRYTWNAVANPNNEGLILAGALPDPTHYSIEMVFAFNTIPPNFNTSFPGWARIIDFKNLEDDEGLYAQSTRLQFFFGHDGPSGVFAAGRDVHLVLTRDGVTDQVTAYINGIQQFTFNDFSGDAIFDGPGNVMHFFIDDDLDIGNDVSPGSADRIRVFNRPLTGTEARFLFSGGNFPVTTGIGVGVSSVDVASGSGYTAPAAVFAGLSVGTGAAAVVRGVVTELKLTAFGAGYTAAPQVALVGGGGSGATATATIDELTGTVNGLVITNPGVGYATAPQVIFSGGGAVTQASARAFLGVTDVNVTSGGSGYGSAANVTIIDRATTTTASFIQPAVGSQVTVSVGTAAWMYLGETIRIIGGGTYSVDAITNNTTVILTNLGALNAATAGATVGSGAAIGTGTRAEALARTSGGAISQVTVTTPRGSGAAGIYGIVDSIVITSGGTGYSQFFTNVNFNNAGTGGSGAEAEATVIGGVVTGIRITDPGSGYRSPPTITITGGTGATGTVRLGVNMTSFGSGYAAAPTVSFTGGGGTGIVGLTTVLGGAVTRVTIINPGSGYTSLPTVSFTDGFPTAPDVAIGGGGGSGAQAVSKINAALTSINVTNIGVGYFANPNVTIGRGDGGAAAEAAALVSAYVRRIAVTNGGAGYTSTPIVQIQSDGVSRVNLIDNNGGLGGSGLGFTSAPTVTFSAPPTGTTATGTAVIDGVVASINVTNGGTGYTSTPLVIITSTSGTGATAVATISGGQVTGITITNGGTGYTSAPTISFNLGGGTGAAASAGIANVVRSVTITNPGSGYTSPPSITFAGGGVPPGIQAQGNVTVSSGVGASAVATIGGGAVTSVTVLNGGRDYDWYNPPRITFVGGGATTAAAATAFLDGGVFDIIPTKGYTTGTTVTFTGGGATTPATAVVDGAVTAVRVTSGGSGWAATPAVAPIVTFVGGGGSGATAVAYVNAAGQIVSIAVRSGGSGYTSPPTISITGIGTGASATATLSLTRVLVTDGGAGYTSPPTVTIAGSGSGATGIATIDEFGKVVAVLITSGANYGSAPTVFISTGQTSTGGVGGGGGVVTATAAGPVFTYLTSDSNGATAVSNINGVVTDVFLTAQGRGYALQPIAAISGVGGLPIPAAVYRQTPQNQIGVGAGINTVGGQIVIDPTNPHILYFGTGDGNNATDSYYGSGVYRSTDRGQTWNLLTDPSLGSFGGPVAGNPLFGFAVNEILLDASASLVYVAVSDRAVFGQTGAGSNNAPYAKNTGVWRYDLNKRTWFNLTALTSNKRVAGRSMQSPTANAPTPPNTPGPDDRWTLSFPQSNASWTDLALVSGVLYAALGTSSGDNNNGVYKIVNPATANNSNDPPTWYIGTPNLTPATDFPIIPQPDNRLENYSALVGGSARHGNVRITSSAPIIAAIANPVINPPSHSLTRILSNFVQTSDGGTTWSGFTVPPNYLANEGDYATAIVTFFNPFTSSTNIFVGGTDQASAMSVGTRNFVQQWNGSAWTEISIDGAGNGPHTGVHNFTVAGNFVFAATDGGLWRYSLQTNLWTSINGDLSTGQINALASHPTDPNILYSAAKGSGVARFEGTQTWTQLYGIPPNPQFDATLTTSSVAVDPNNPSRMFAYHQGAPWPIFFTNLPSPAARLFVSTNGGQPGSWTDTGVNTLADGNKNGKVVIDKLSRVFAAGRIGSLTGLSVNFPPTIPGWMSLNAPLTPTSIAVAEMQGPFVADPRFANVTDLGATSPDPNTIYIAEDSFISVTKNFGLSWSNADAGGGTVRDIKVDPRNRDHIFAATGTTVRESTDAGQNWTTISTGLPGEPVWALAFDPRHDLLYVATDRGVYQCSTSTGARQWVSFGEHLPQVPIHALDLNETTNILTAGSYGRGVYQFFIDTPTVNSGALYVGGGSGIWNGPIILAGPATINAGGDQILQNGVSLTQLTILGTISDQTYEQKISGANTLTKIGGGNITLGGGTPNLFGGTTLVKEGNLIIQNPGALGVAGVTGTQALYIDGAGVNSTQFQLYFDPAGGAAVNGFNQTAPITFTGAEADATTIANALNGLTTIGGLLPTAGSVTVTPEGDGAFLITFGGALAGIDRPLIIARVTSGTGSAYAVAAGSTVVADGAILQLRTNLDAEPLFLFGNGVQDNNHFTGALQNVAGNNTYTGTITLMTNSTIGVDSTSTLTITSTNPNVVPAITDLNGPGRQQSITKEGAGTLILASTNSYEGGTSLNQGVLNIRHGGALGAPGTTTTVLDATQLQLQQGLAGPVNVSNQNLVISGVGPSSTGAFVNVAGNNTWGSAANTVVLTSLPSFGPQSAPGGLVSFTVTNPGDTLTIGSTIGESPAFQSSPASPALTLQAGLVKIGPGRLVLTQNNTYSGSSYIQNGIVSIQKSNSLGNASGNAVQRVTVLDPSLSSSTTGTTTNSFRLTSGTSTTSAINPRDSASSVAAALNAILGANAVSVSYAEVYSGISEVHSLAFTNAIPGVTQFRLSWRGAQTSPITYTGVAATDIANIRNALNAASFSTIGGLSPFSGTANAGQVSVTANATATVFEITFGGQLQKQTLTPVIGVSITSAAGTGTATTQRVRTGIGVPTVVYTVIFSGAAFAGRPQPLLGTSNVSGGVTVSISTVADGGIGTLVSPGTTLQLDADPLHNNSSLSAPEWLTLNGTGVGNQGALRNVSGHNTLSGRVTLNSSTTVAIDPTTRLTISGTVQDPSPAPIPPASVVPADLTKVGTGALVLQSANTYTGNTFINEGVLNIQNPNALGINNSSQQLINISGTGTFTLHFSGFPSITTGALPAPINAAGLAFFLNNLLLGTTEPLLGGGAGTVTVVPASGTSFFLTFGGSLTGRSVPLLIAPSADFTGSAIITTSMVLQGDSSRTIVANGATLQIQNANENSLKRLTINGPGFNNAGALQNVAGSNTWSDYPITMGSTSAIGADAGSTLFINRQITDNGQNFGLNKVGAGTVQFTTDGPLLNTPGLTGGGTIPTGTTFYYVVTAWGLNGESLPGTEQSITTTANNQAITLTWSAVPGAGGYKVYRSTTPAPYASPSLLATIGTPTTNYTDTGTAVGAGAPPTGNLYGGLTDVRAGTLELNMTGGARSVPAHLQVGDNTPVSQVHTLDLSTFTLGDQFTLSYNGSPASAAITYFTNPTYAANLIQVALNGLSTIGGLAPTPGSVIVTPAGVPGRFLVAFGGSLAGVLAFTPITATNLTTPGSVTSTLTTPGAAFAPNSAIARLLFRNQLAPSANVTVNSDGLFDVNNQSQVVNTLLVNTGTATTGTGATGGTLTASSVTLNAGRLNAPGQNSLVTVSGPLNINDGFVNTSTSQTNSQVIVNGLTTMNGGQVNLTLPSSRFTLGGNLTTTSNSVGASQFLGAGTLALGGANRIFTVNHGASATVTTDLYVSTPIGGVGAETLTKVGAGRMELDGVSTYTGNTILTAGDLQVDGSIVSNVVMTGGTLSGTGSVGTIAGTSPAVGTVSPGDNAAANPIGTLSSQPVSWGSDTTFFVNLTHTGGGLGGPRVAGVDNDLLSVGGTGVVVDIGGATLAGTVDPSVVLNDVFTIIQTTGGGTITGKFFEQFAANTVFIAGFKFGVTYNATSVVLTRERATATMSIASSANPSVYGQQVLYTATLTPEPGSGPIPMTDTVTFTFDGVTYPPVFVNASGQAGFNPQAATGGPLTLGTHTLHADFSGDPNTYNPASADLTPNQTVNKQNTTVSVTSVPAVTATSPIYTQSVTLTATVATTIAPMVAGSLLPTGTITFILDPFSASPQSVIVPLNPVTLTASVTLPADLPIASLIAAGAHTVTATYSGDTRYNAPAPTPFALTIQKDTTSVAITPFIAPMGQTQRFDVVVTPGLAGSPGVPHGTVSIYDGSTLNPPLGTGSYTGGTFTFNASNMAQSLSHGPHTIFVVFTDDPGTDPGADGNFFGSQASISITIPQAPTQTTFQNIAPASPTFGQAVTITIGVAPNPLINTGIFGAPTGTVTVWEGAVGPGGLNLGTGAVSGAGVATITTTNTALTRGTHNLFAVYSGDAAYLGSSATFNGLVVGPAVTSTAVTANPNSGAVFGQTVILSAIVSGPPGTTPTPGSSVVFVDTTTPGSPITLGTATTNAFGLATLPTNLIPVGTRTITATFTDVSPTGNFATSSGQLVGFVVGKASTNTSVTASPAGTAIFGQTVTLTATVTSPTGIPPAGVGPGSSVAFFDVTTATPLGSANLMPGGTATFNVSTLTVGTHTISATYIDTFDGNFLGSTGSLSGYIITRANTNTSLIANPVTGVFSQVVTLTATVTSPTAPPPVGVGNNVVFVDVTTGTTLGSAFTTAGGVASIQTSVLTATTHQITATYTDNTASPNYNGSSGTLNNYIVGAAPTAISSFIPVLPSPAIGQIITLTATASTVAPATALVDAGTITFTDTTTGIVLGTVNVDASGVAALPNVSFATSGNHVISAKYNGAGPRFNPSATATMTQIVRKISTVNVSPVAGVMFGQIATFAVTVTGSPGIPTGTVSVLDQTTSTNYGPFTLVSGAVNIPIAGLAAGPHSLVFTYSGDTSPFPGFGISSTTITQVINKANTSATTTPLTGSSIFGQTVTLNATITGATGIHPTTGVVGFYDNFGGTLTLLGTGTLSGTNSTSFTTNATQLGAGTHLIMAIYAGSANFAISPFSSPRTQTVAKATTATVLSATTPSFYGNAVTFTATVSATSAGSPGSPAGNTVAFMAGATLLGTAVTNASGVATFTTTPTQLAFGNYTITATNQGNANFAGSAASAPQTHVVNKAGTQTTLTSSAPSGTIYGNAVTFTANVTVTTGGTPGVPPGYIIFFDGATNLGIVPMVNGSASITLANLNAGTHPMRAFYAPSGPNFLSTASPFVNQVVSQATTATTLTSAPVTWMLGQAITFTARVTTTSGGAPGTPTGSVQFNVDGVLTTVPLVNGVATLSQTFTTAGSHTVSAIYLPATAPAQNFQGSAAAPMTQNVKKPTTTTLTSTSNPDDVTLRATVSTSATGGPPTGTVYFYEYLNNAYILLGFSTLVNGVATFSADLAQGNHTIIAFYLGDTNFAASAAVAIVPGKTGGRVV